ncbi:MAG: hypothetical protein AMS24_00920 [Chlamydiae bacterium SM23_39]|nr:MAG: hypothetical protein AMS24_00920 [Chlamydiae bacterium SM23_39]
MINNTCPCCLKNIKKNEAFNPAREERKILKISYLASKKILKILEEKTGKIKKACNHRFCKSCLKKWIQTEKKESCPLCRSFANSGIKETKNIRKGKKCQKIHRLSIFDITQLNPKKIKKYAQKMIADNKQSEIKALTKDIKALS